MTENLMSKSSGRIYLFFLLIMTLDIGHWTLDSSSVWAKGPAGALVDIVDLAPSIVIDIRYATDNNFTGEKLYPAGRCLMRRQPAEQLTKVQKELRKKGLGLKVWDCYRPLSVQKRLWEKVHDERYVANPSKGSRHNRGAAVDLTLVDAVGRELEMPTAYDDFSAKAHRDYSGASDAAKGNRGFLESAMSRRRFIGLASEWWHFDYENSDQLELMDWPLEPIPQVATSRQLIVVISDDWASSKGKAYLFNWEGEWEQLRDLASGVEESGRWRRVKKFSVSLGRQGMGWGQGLHPDNLEGAYLLEGDGRSPAGVFTLAGAFGYEPTLPLISRIGYRQSTLTLRCVNDPRSDYYNSIAEDGDFKDWKSAENMLRADDLYRWLIVVDHNTNNPKPGKGSCVFLHLRGKSRGPTERGTAFSKKDFEFLLSWIDLTSNPLLIQMPLSVYEDVQGLWALPELR
ncbi:MAG: D-alanyl-D-alanine carboxypeptidase family protein [Elusimicrobia bacterium]|nr:D-alanyl-D-alanine carboxypeptidase family protein [Elusimicrobiota bacterium]